MSTEPKPHPRAEGILSIWGRRAISLPLYAVLAAFVLGTLPVWVPVALLVDLVSGKRRLLPRTRAVGFFALYLACEALGVMASFALWVKSIAGLGDPLDDNAALQRWWTRALFHGGAWLFSWRIAVEGAELAREGPMLLFVRHSSAADTVLAAALVANPNRLLLRYVLKRELLWDPCLDIVGRRLPNTFVDRQSGRRDAELEAVARLGEGLDARSAALIYPEGTRFRPGKLARAVEALRTQGKTELAALAEGFQNVLPPRLGGPLALLAAAPNADVVFVEHTGFEGAASFGEFWNGALVGSAVRVRLRRVPAASIPTVDRERWLYEQWAETDRWITAQLRSVETSR